MKELKNSTKEKLTLFIYIFIGTVLALFIYTYSCQAAEPPKIGDFIEVSNNHNAMVYYPSIPLTTERFITFGQLKNLKGNIVADTSTEVKVVPLAKDLRSRLLQIKTSRGFLALKVVIIQHNQITLLKYETVLWEEIIPEIQKNFSVLEN